MFEAMRDSIAVSYRKREARLSHQRDVLLLSGGVDGISNRSDVSCRYEDRLDGFEQHRAPKLFPG